MTEKWTHKQQQFLRIRLASYVANKKAVPVSEAKRIITEMPLLFKQRGVADIQVSSIFRTSHSTTYKIFLY